MNKIIWLAFFLILIGCKSTYLPSYTGEVIEVKASELSNYWIKEPTKVKVQWGHSDSTPKGAGKGIFSIVIDSNGYEVAKELVSSTPSGWLTQKHLNKMSKVKYKASLSNTKKFPVKVKMTYEVKRYKLTKT